MDDVEYDAQYGAIDVNIEDISALRSQGACAYNFRRHTVHGIAEPSPCHLHHVMPSRIHHYHTACSELRVNEHAPILIGRTRSQQQSLKLIDLYNAVYTEDLVQCVVDASNVKIRAHNIRKQASGYRPHGNVREITVSEYHWYVAIVIIMPLEHMDNMKMHWCAGESSSEVQTAIQAAPDTRSL